jgi:uncharacterized repeat protein (TIGR03803 family)
MKKLYPLISSKYLFILLFLKKTVVYYSTLLLLVIPFFIQAQDVLMGMTSNGGTEGKGTAFTVKTNGSLFSVISPFADWGKNPNGSLIKGPDANYYGMTYTGGTFGSGTIFKISPAGLITILHQLNYATDGANPFGNLTLGKDGLLYGMTNIGGVNSYGTIFKITTAGLFTVIKSFNNSTDGANPQGQMVQATDGNFYGITRRGGSGAGFGTIFRMTPAGVYTVVKALTNSATEGSYCYGSLSLASDGNLYGMTSFGGKYNYGTIFKVTTAGIYSVLKHLNLLVDGGAPKNNLVQAPDGFLYGMVQGGGTNGNGTIIRISTAGVFSVLRHLKASTDGGSPYGTLIVGADGLLYGMTSFGGVNIGGTIFKMATNGTSFSVIRALKSTLDGGSGRSDLLLGTDNNFYGLTSDGGSNFLGGTAFKITPAGVYTVLAKFNGGLPGNAPYENIIQATDYSLYGTTSSGGAFNYGTIFRICGGVYTVLHSFNRSTEGGVPKGSLVQAGDGNFYGLTSQGGNSGAGTAFKITSMGIFTVLHHFVAASEGSSPLGSLIQGKDGFFYGMGNTGGSGNAGTVFKMSTAGVVTLVHPFISTTQGAYPEGSLIQAADNNFYGMTTQNPRIFKLTSGGVFTILKALSAGTEGFTPLGSLVQGTDLNLYGTMSAGGSSAAGTIFKITTTGVYTVLKHLVPSTDGGTSRATLVRAADGFFYGMTSAGGTNKAGTIFKVSASGIYTVLRHLNLLADGGTPFGGLIVLKPVTVIANPQSAFTNEDVSKTLTLAGSGGSPLVYNIVTVPKNGLVTGTGAARTYTPNSNYNGKDSFYFTVSIGCNTSAPAKVSIAVTAVNDAPVLSTIGNKTGKTGTPLTFIARSTDPDFGQTNTFSLIGGPAGANINAGTGAFMWTPAATGNFTLKVRVTDNGVPVLFDEEQIIITVGAAAVSAANIELMPLVNRMPLKEETVYPNPVRDRFTVALNAGNAPTSATLNSVSGIMIKEWLLRNQFGGKIAFDITGIKPGTYILHVFSADKNWVFKIVKL